MALGAGEKDATVLQTLITKYCRTHICILDCLRLTKAIQKTSESLQTVADLYDDHVSGLPFC